MSVGDSEFIRVCQVPVDYFLDAVLPTIPSDICISDVRSSLEGDTTDSARWKASSENPSSHIFQDLSSVFAAITGAVQEKTRADITQTVTLLPNPTMMPYSNRTSSSRPDAYLILDNKKSVASLPGKDSWDDIAVPVEFRKSSDKQECNENTSKVLWSLQQIMRSDPCRRFTFGITVEDTDMRLWFTCRAMTLVSDSLEFVTDIDRMIRLVSSLAFAQDHQLGWDPNFERVLVGTEVQYDITFKEPQPAVYRTVSVLSDLGAEALDGRETWVFKAYDLDRYLCAPRNPEEYVVVKDTWRDSDRMSEDEILLQIFQDIQDKDPTKAAEAKEHFITVIRGEDVVIEGRVDETTQFLRDRPLPDILNWYKVTPEDPYPDSFEQCDGFVLLFRISVLPKHEKIRHKTHHRIVFKEVCTPLRELRSHFEMQDTLADILEGLRYLQLAGWVHRDLSPGNLMRYGNRGLIADLEYAKKLDKMEGPCDVRTGTAGFLACEVECQAYLFPGPTSRLVGEPVVPPFRTNSLHDLESWWWNLMWSTCHYVDSANEELYPQHESFYSSFFHPSRVASLLAPRRLDALVGPRKTFALAGNVMREVLKASYQLAERGYPRIDAVEPARSCLEEFQAVHDRARERSRLGPDISLIPLRVSQKRNAGHLESTSGSEGSSAKRRTH